MDVKRKPPNAGKGRPKGSPNKATIETREAFTRLVEGKHEELDSWLTQTAKGIQNEAGDKYLVLPNPAKALELVISLAEYVTPKLARTEHVGENGGPIVTAKPSDLAL